LVIKKAFDIISGALKTAGIEDSRFEAECILQNGGISATDIIAYPEREMPDSDAEKALNVTVRRLMGEPLQYVLGEWEFYGLPFKVGEGVLIPRQDTETLVELAEDFLKKRGEKPIAADLCAGSGCIGITLAKRLGCAAKCYELSDKAIGFLKENIALNSAEALAEPIKADVLDKRTADGAELFDAILSNPPYLTKDDMERLQKEVEFEPKTALYGGEDGLDFYRGIIPIWKSRLKEGGLFAVEIGMGQEEDVMRIFAENGFEPDCKKDLCGINRVVFAIK
jgi:release factor glutamine methyltransferase